MPNLLETLLQQQGGALVREMAKSAQLSESDAGAALKHLAPALARGLSKNTRQPGGLEALVGALQGGGHARHVENPGRIGSADAVADGNAILGHIFGSKDVSRNVAGHAAKQTGLDASALKKMLPMVAAAAMGSMGQSSGGGGGAGGLLGQLLGGGNKPDPGMAGVLEGFLDSDKDGAVVDDLLSMAQKFF